MTTYLSLSGGMDSTALASHLKKTTQDEIVGVSFNYNQRHKKELKSAAAVAKHLGIEHRTIDLPRLSSPALTGDTPVPHGHYAAETMVLTVVQGRNLLFLSTLVTLTKPGDTIAIGVHNGDHAMYPDCRNEFIDPIKQGIEAAYGINVIAPFVNISKADIANVGHNANAPFELSWSCYEGGDIHCGRCGTCVERAEAFYLAGVPDPTVYKDNQFWREVV